MAVPKKRTGHSAQGHRRSNWKATKPETTKCPNCGATVLTHTVCTECGTYKGQPVSLKDRKPVPVVKTEKKSVKKSAKSAEKVEEVKAEEKAEVTEATEEKPAKKSTKKAKTEAKTEEKVEEAKAEETAEE